MDKIKIIRRINKCLKRNSKSEVEALNEKPHELTDEELAQVSGGVPTDRQSLTTTSTNIDD